MPSTTQFLVSPQRLGYQVLQRLDLRPRPDRDRPPSDPGRVPPPAKSIAAEIRTRESPLDDPSPSRHGLGGGRGSGESNWPVCIAVHRSYSQRIAGNTSMSRTARSNFTNEGRIGDACRLLTNMIGLWLIEGCRDAGNGMESGRDMGNDDRPVRRLGFDP